MIEHSLSEASIAIVYDHLTTRYGGAELVLQTLLKLFPQADIYTTVFDETSINWIHSEEKLHISFLQKFGFIKKYHQLLLPLHPLAIEQLDVTKYQIVISLTAGVAKGVLTLPNQLHVSYMLTPPRYLDIQDPELAQYVRSQTMIKIPGLHAGVKPLFDYLRRWDQIAAWRPDKVIAISKVVEQRIISQYKRKIDRILYPPFIPLKESFERGSKIPFLLSFSRLASYKRVDLSIKSALKTKRLLIVAGEGVEKARLLKVAQRNYIVRRKNESVTACIQRAVTAEKLIVFVGYCSEQEKSFLFKHCSALLMPGIEDFGLIGLEAASVGTPIITNCHSGVAEVLTSKHAVHIREKSVAAVSAAIFELEKKQWNSKQLMSIATKYSEDSFSEHFLNTLYQFWIQHSTISPVSVRKKE